MKWLVAALLVALFATCIVADSEVKTAQEASAKHIQETDNFYYGMCQDARAAGWGFSKNYRDLCGDN